MNAEDVRIPISLVEIFVFNPPEGLEEWRCYRQEVGGHARECIVEGTIWLPPGVDPETIERILQGGDPCTNTE